MPSDFGDEKLNPRLGKPVKIDRAGFIRRINLEEKDKLKTQREKRKTFDLPFQTELSFPSLILQNYHLFLSMKPRKKDEPRRLVKDNSTFTEERVRMNACMR